MLKKIGAAEKNNLEPFSAPELLEELEDWSEIIKSAPEFQNVLETQCSLDLPEMEP